MKSASLIFSDFKNIRHDPMLMMATTAPVLITLVLLFGFPALNTLLLDKLSFSIDGYYTFTCIFMLPLIPMLFGMVHGFILLDERDEGMITYFAVTPLGKNGYLWMRMLAPVLFSFVVILLFIWITGFERFLWWKHIPLALITAFQAPIMVLFLGGYAANKVEGMAIAKGFGILLMAVPIDFFISSNWTFIVGASPLFWTARGFLAQEALHIILYIFMALVVHAGYLVVLFKKFNEFEI